MRGLTIASTASLESQKVIPDIFVFLTLPFGTMVKVTNRRNGKAVTVRINDREPFIRGRVIDITSTAAQALGF